MAHRLATRNGAANVAKPFQTITIIRPVKVAKARAGGKASTARIEIGGASKKASPFFLVAKCAVFTAGNHRPIHPSELGIALRLSIHF